eukprot:TRINITY_DN127_c0_g1_i4.p1 TRINITY_DN127_c0_g1~~TRINITY_DN127_c0_g1_i4.p1  ORF type:complete len:580 (-),score=76.40 TRINITY_DN127_c0_g1_i4:229-1908(-)
MVALRVRVFFLVCVCAFAALDQNESCAKDPGMLQSADTSLMQMPGTSVTSESSEQVEQSAGLWQTAEVASAKSKVFEMFESNMRWYGKPMVKPGTVLRLSFHDCVKYTDGTGGCDGCLNWNGVDVERFPQNVISRLTSSVDDVDEGVGANNALGDVVRELEKIYTSKFHHSHNLSMKQRGFSRADFWALAGIAAVEFTMAINNDVCDTGRRPNETSREFMKMGQCLWAQKEATCKAIPQRSLIFKTGRKDCTTRLSPSYKTDKPEKHPDAHMNGKSVVKFMKEQFGLDGKETVALMGAHTIGRYHDKMTGFKYVWTPRSEMSFNNEYYRNMVLQPVHFYDNDQCVGSRGAWGEMPQSRWVVKANLFTRSGGPIQWIRVSHIGPDCVSRRPAGSRWWPKSFKECCTKGVPPGAWSRPDNGRPRGSDSVASDDDEHGGCEKWLFLFGRDHAMLNTDMGLYLDFDVEEHGYPRNCPGLETFTESNVARKNRTGPEIGPAAWHRWAWQECPKQRFAEPPTGKPLYEYVELFAANQTAWLDTFVPAMEKYLENGYAPGQLTPVE